MIKEGKSFEIVASPAAGKEGKMTTATKMTTTTKTTTTKMTTKTSMTTTDDDNDNNDVTLRHPMRGNDGTLRH